MADEQGTGVPDGNFARSKAGGAVNGILDNVGSDGRKYVPQDAAPAGADEGDVYLADGTNWDPLSGGNAALVIYLAGGWVAIQEFTGVGGL